MKSKAKSIITKEDFEKINSKLAEDDKYKNPRNLASGSVRQLDSKIAKERHIRFVVWKVPYGFTKFTDGFNYAKEQGFKLSHTFFITVIKMTLIRSLMN